MGGTKPTRLEPWSHSLAFTAEIRKQKLLVHLILNAYWKSLDFELPSVKESKGKSWRRWIDTALDSPRDIVPWQEAASVSGQTYRAEARSVVVLFANLK
jgi:glycogen operon protein